jgi:hypothetical protein
VNPSLTINPFFTASSFGPTSPTPYPHDARMRIEVTNPVVVESPGTNAGDMVFYQLTATVFAELKSTAGPLTPPETMVVGRGRITVGPVRPLAGCAR